MTAAGFEGDNPLIDSDNYEVYLKSVETQADLVKYAEGLDGVRQVNKSDVVADALGNSECAHCICLRRNYPDSACSIYFPDQQYGYDGNYNQT